jgi:tRNA (guanosine-2'-O-)-methyltransferase
VSQIFNEVIMSDIKVLEEFYKIITPNKQNMFDRLAAERTKHMTVVLENVYQEHNASAILRTCDCFGIQELHVIEKDNQYKVQRDIALGAGRWVDMYNFNLGEEPEIDCVRKLKNQGYRIVATTPHTNDFTLNDLPIDQPFALIFGTERKGISDEMKNLADDFVSIPMYGFTESFNVSVSVALTLQMLRHRLELSELMWKLSTQEQTLLKIKWCTKILNGGPELEKVFRLKYS